MHSEYHTLGEKSPKYKLIRKRDKALRIQQRQHFVVGAAQFIADIDCIRSAIGDAVKGADDIMGIHLRTAPPLDLGNFGIGADNGQRIYILFVHL